MGLFERRIFEVDLLGHRSESLLKIFIAVFLSARRMVSVPSKPKRYNERSDK
jgi:hypothetical protein